MVRSSRQMKKPDYRKLAGLDDDWEYWDVDSAVKKDYRLELC